MFWLLILLALVLLIAAGYGTFYILVKWILTDAPPGTRFFGISNDAAGRAPAVPTDKPEGE